MVKIGDVVAVEVQNVEVYGVFCRHNSEDMLLLIPETSWIASYCSCHQFAEPGDHLTVKIKYVDTESGKIAASIIDLHPNPWETDQLDVGNTHIARVVRYVAEADRCDDKPGYLLEILPGAYAMIDAHGLTLEPNQECKVTIQESDPFKHAVRVDVSEQRS